MIIENIRPNNNEEENNFNPVKTKTTIIMAVATSIDALAIGVSFAFLYNSNITEIIIPVGVIGLVSFIMSVSGFIGGVCFAKIKKMKPELIGGLILIGIGLKILIEHISKNI